MLIFLGVLVVFAGLLMQGFQDNGKTRADVRGGAVVFIGPVPIIMGTDRNSAIAVAVLALILIAAAYIFLSR